MTGTKAQALDGFCAARGLAYLRFDPFGHGASSGDVLAGTIGRWAADAIAVLDRLTEGPQILVGSSMGAWLMLLAARARPERIAALLGIAAAPDFTEDLMWGAMAPAEQRALEEQGRLAVPSRYGDDYAIPFGLISEARAHLLLRGPLALDRPVRLLHGMADADVPWETSLRLAEALTGGDVRLTLIKDGDHRLSRPQDLALLEAELEGLLAACGSPGSRPG